MPPSLTETYLAELIAALLYKIWRGKKPTLTRYNNLRQFINNCIVPTQLTFPVVIQALAYVNRLKQKFPQLPDMEGAECRIFLVGLILANKHLDDCNYTNKVWAQVSGISNEEINLMEMEYLNVMEYETFLHPDYIASFTAEMRTLAESMSLDSLLVDCAQEIAVALNGTYEADDVREKKKLNGMKTLSSKTLLKRRDSSTGFFSKKAPLKPIEKKMEMTLEESLATQLSLRNKEDTSNGSLKQSLENGATQSD